jgi:hypothetical protein
MYIDEVGSADQGVSNDPNHRYLSLTGVIVELAATRVQLRPEFERLKLKYFSGDPDRLVVFHRSEIIKGENAFTVLKSPAVREAFNKDLLAVMDAVQFVVVTAVIDKVDHQAKYGRWAAHPYHYCLEILLERFVRWLEDPAIRSRGDLMAESRGKKEDWSLKEAYRALYSEGTSFINPTRIAARITSRELKLEKKHTNVAGLQLVDLVAHPSFRDMRLRKEGLPPKADFGSQIAGLLLRSKYRRGPFGQIDRFGTKWLP